MQAIGKSRDQRVLEGIEKFRYMSTPQVAQLFFANTIKDQEQAHKKACERLKRMYDRGYLTRFRFPGEPFIFTIKGGKFSTMIQHYLMLVNCWIELQRIRPAGAILRCEVEKKQGDDIIADLIVEYKNNFTLDHKVYFVELERESHGDLAEKMRKYEGLFWAREARNEPEGYLVLVCTKKSTRAKIEGNQANINMMVIYYKSFAEEWKW